CKAMTFPDSSAVAKPWNRGNSLRAEHIAAWKIYSPAANRIRHAVLAMSRMDGATRLMSPAIAMQQRWIAQEENSGQDQEPESVTRIFYCQNALGKDF
ncbi:MAG: hypothetical protein P4M13_00545, partial [Alphaproteobacteria bacterium]|nr:hypothetical protein [Alphaproteobacteria bacterium]